MGGLDAPSGLALWWLALRPKTLLAGVVPVVVGTAIAWEAGFFSAGPATAALLGACLIQIATNLANDFFDHRSGADNADRIGPARATQQGWVSPRQMAVATGISLVLATAIGAYLIAVGGWPIAIIGVLSLALAIGYTGGPFPLAYHGLGDIFVLIFFGFVATAGTVWVQGLVWSGAAIWAGGAIGLLATAILVVNNLRDRMTDAAANKRTLAVRFGARACRWEHSLCIGGAFALVTAAPLCGIGGWGWCLPWLALPLAVGEIRAIWAKDGAALNPHLGGAARLEMVFGLLLSIGIVLG